MDDAVLRSVRNLVERTEPSWEILSENLQKTSLDANSFSRTNDGRVVSLGKEMDRQWGAEQFSGWRQLVGGRRYRQDPQRQVASRKRWPDRMRLHYRIDSKKRHKKKGNIGGGMVVQGLPDWRLRD